MMHHLSRRGDHRDNQQLHHLASRGGIALVLALFLALLPGCTENKSEPAAAQVIDESVNPQERLILALEKQDLDEVNKALAAGSDPKGYATAELTPLEHAARSGFIAGGKALLARGVDVNGRLVTGKDKEGKETNRRVNVPLHAALASYQADFAKMLIENNADPNIVNNRHRTALDMANGAVDEMNATLQSPEKMRDRTPEDAQKLAEQRDKMVAFVAFLKSPAPGIGRERGKTAQELNDEKLNREIEAKKGGILGQLPEKVRFGTLPPERSGNPESGETGTSSDPEKPTKIEIPTLP